MACGPGLHAETLAKSFLRGEGSTLVSCDFSKGMVEQMKRRFEGSDYGQKCGNKFVMDTETDYANLQSDQRVDLDSIIAQSKPFDKLVYGCLADNMKLPFADNSFEAYISNLSLMIVQHRERMISEAFRVLKPGARACISTWGREENMSVFRIFRQAHTNIGR